MTKTKDKTQPTKRSKSKMLMGFLWIFLATVSLFQLELLGALLSNLLRFFIGETYDLFLMISLIPAVEWVVNADRPFLKGKRQFGVWLLLAALTLLLSVTTYQVADPVHLFSDFFNDFKNQLLVGQVNGDLNGGLLGNVLYTLLQPLIGFWGILIVVLMTGVPGLLLLVGIDQSMLKATAHNLQQGLRRMGQGTSKRVREVRDVYEQRQQNQPESDQAAKSKPSSSQQGGLLTKVRDLFVDDTTPLSWDKDYQPSFEPEEPKTFETFDEQAPLAQTARRRRASGPVLDLDYFDRQDTEEEAVVPKITSSQAVKEPSSVEIRMDDLQTSASTSQAVKEPPSVEIRMDDLQTSASTTPLAGDKAMNETTITESVPPPVMNTPEVAPPIDSETATTREQALHWQEQANAFSSVTANPLDDYLQSGSFTEVKPVKRQAHYQLPGKELLSSIAPVDQSEEYERINNNIEILEKTFKSFGVDAKVVQAHLGPAVTKYEIEPAIGVRVNRIVALSDDIALALSATDVRIEAPIPGKALIGIEVPNTQISPVSFAEIIDPALESKKMLEVPLGRDISGKVCLVDLSAMPHLLIAGATGSGKSVGMNVIISSLLMKATPEEVKLLMIDPKMVELTLYNDIPHLLAPVVTNPRKAAQALNKVVQEMERRYELFQTTGVRNIDGFNDKVTTLNQKQGTGYEKLPKIVVFVDELADLMLVASNEVETAIIRLAQMARAAGIHMIIATQRPSVDVITGIIKANVPSRLAFAVSSGTDSRTILDANGAEKLLGRGDLLFQPMGTNKPIRVQGAYISDQEVERITDFIKEQRKAEYDETMIVTEEDQVDQADSEDEYFPDAVALLQDQETISISQLQRRFRIGYNRAARMVDDLEAHGYVGPQQGSKPRQVLYQPDE